MLKSLCINPIDTSVLERRLRNLKLKQIKANASPSSLLGLPVELLATFIEGYLNHQTKLTLRQVHSLFQILLDDYLGYRVTLDKDDTKEKLNFLSKIAIRKITLISPSDGKYKNGKREEELEQGPWDKENGPRLKEFIRYPWYLKEIQIKGDIDFSLMCEIVQYCRVIETLELCPGACVTSNNPVMWNCSLDASDDIDIDTGEPLEEPCTATLLNKCRTLKLHLKDHDPSTSHKLSCITILTILKAVKSLFLNCIVFEFWITEELSVSELTLVAAKCLEKNPFIESFFMGIVFSPLHTNEEPISSDEIPLQEIIETKFKKLGKTLRLKKLGIATRSVDMILWKNLIQSQHHLAHLSLTVNLEAGIFSQELFKNFAHSLTQFILRGNYVVMFDCNWIEDCHKLKEICLHNTTEFDRVDEGLLVHVVNLASLPANLQSLILFQAVSRSDDVIATLRKLKNLHTLVLFKVGNIAGDTGVNLACLKQILNSRTLQSTLLVRVVAANPPEAKKLINILKAINHGYGLFDPAGFTEIMEIIDNPPVIHEDMPLLEHIHEAQSNPEVSDAPSTDENFIVSESEPEEITEDGNNNQAQASGAGVTNAKKNIKNTTVSSSHEMEPHLLTESESTDNLEEEIKYPTEIEAQQDVPVRKTKKLVSYTFPASNDEENDGEVTEIEIEETDEEDEETTGDESNVENAEDAEWVDVDEDGNSVYYGTSSDEDDGDDDVFDMDLDDLNLLGDAGNGENFQFLLNLQDEGDLNEVIGMLEPQEENNNMNAVNFSFILDGVIDIMDPHTKLSKWVSVEDSEGHLTYTLRINID